MTAPVPAPPVPQRAAPTLSSEQQRIVDAALGCADNLLISACAGGSKTFTMCAIARVVGPGRKTVALAFGKDAATVLQAKMPYWVESTTFHSYCFGALRARHPKLRVDGNRAKWLLKDLVPQWNDRRQIESNVLALVSRFKSTTLDLTPEAIRTVADTCDFDPTDRELGIALRVLDECTKVGIKVDFDDMLWLTHRERCAFTPPPALVLLDEAQDTNAVQRALLAQMLGGQSIQRPVILNDPQYNGVAVTQRGRLIAVGDPHQSIYAFRGADHDAMPELRSAFAMRELTLSVSYRCSQAGVAEAQKYL